MQVNVRHSKLGAVVVAEGIARSRFAVRGGLGLPKRGFPLKLGSFSQAALALRGGKGGMEEQVRSASRQASLAGRCGAAVRGHAQGQALVPSARPRATVTRWHLPRPLTRASMAIWNALLASSFMLPMTWRLATKALLLAWRAASRAARSSRLARRLRGAGTCAVPPDKWPTLVALPPPSEESPELPQWQLSLLSHWQP